MQIRPGIELAGLSDVGCQRDNNEDRHSYWEPSSDDEFRRKGRLATVADGMGGYEGGQEASRIAVQTIESVYARKADGAPRAMLLAGFQAAHEGIKEHAAKHPALLGMGTTCTAIVVLGHQLYYAHVGDSRLYLARDSKIYRLTRDQSYVGRLVEQGIISPEEAVSHPQRHILTAALGSGSELAPESPEQPVPLEEDDVLVLCTDGLWSLVSEQEIRSVVASEGPEQACRDLIQMAKSRGGPDNITVQVVAIGKDCGG
jgi:protein phosphatase